MYEIQDLNYMVSLYCPGKCVNCNIWKYDRKQITKDELNLDIFEKIFTSKYLKDTKYFDLTAGESQLSPKYIDVIKIIAKYKPNAFIHTNISGWYPKEHYKITKEAIKHINPKNFRLDVSLDGKEENYKNIRLVKDGYKKVLETIKLLKNTEIKLRVVMIVYKQNYKDIPWFVEFAKSEKIDYFIGYARNASLLKNKHNKYSFSLNELSEIERLLHKVKWLTKKREPNWLWAKSIYQNKIPFFDCYMGQKSLVIDPYGNVYPCNECLDFLKMGNLNDFDGNLDDLLQSEQALNVIDKIVKKECQPCGMLCAHKIEFPWGKQVGLL